MLLYFDEPRGQVGVTRDSERIARFLGTVGPRRARPSPDFSYCR